MVLFGKAKVRSKVAGPTDAVCAGSAAQLPPKLGVRGCRGFGLLVWTLAALRLVFSLSGYKLHQAPRAGNKVVCVCVNVPADQFLGAECTAGLVKLFRISPSNVTSSKQDSSCEQKCVCLCVCVCVFFAQRPRNPEQSLILAGICRTPAHATACAPLQNVLQHIVL